MDKNFPLEPAVIWFRRDLRIDDNPALAAAHKSGRPIVPLFIYDPKKEIGIGSASKWWLHHSISALSQQLNALGAPFVLRQGDEQQTLLSVVREVGAQSVFWNRRYDKTSVETDKSLKAELEGSGVNVETFNGNLLCEPWTLKTGQGGFYRVFTPYWRALQKSGPTRSNLAPKPKTLSAASSIKSDPLAKWALTPAKPDWAAEFSQDWTPGEQGGKQNLRLFLKETVNQYADGRDLPGIEATSRLSPHLAFGEISPLRIWREVTNKIAAAEINEQNALKFLSEIAWREFSYNLLFHNPALPTSPLREEFNHYPWRDDQDGFNAWTRGMTGYPIVDAGMRQLWRTGWMHNRVRMIVASFLIKDLLIPWQNGAAWFWDTLLDADLASNSASWQWVAGCGADAAPYFRIFNPTTQGKKFDPDGAYIRKFVPELERLPNKYIHEPNAAPDHVLKNADIILGKTYPIPILDHSAARKRALSGYQSIRAG